MTFINSYVIGFFRKYIGISCIDFYGGLKLNGILGEFYVLAFIFAKTKTNQKDYS